MLSYEYNALGNVIKMTDENGNETSYTYTPNGNLASVTDALGNETYYSYDGMGHLIKIERMGEMQSDNAADEKCGTQTTLYEWNYEGLVTGITDPLGEVEKFAYDKGGRMTDKWDRDSYHTGYSYDRRNLMTDILYADGKKVSYSYDSLRRLEEIKDSTGTTRIVMDALGRALAITDGQGKTTVYEWDSMNERTRLIYPDGKEVTYDYNERGLLETLTTRNGIIHYAYDEIGRLKEKKFPNGVTTEYDYNSIGRLEKIHHTGNGFWEEYLYQYDMAGNKTEVEKLRQGIEEDRGRFCYNYDALRHLTEVSKDGVLLRKYSYDSFGNRTIKEDYSGGIQEQTLYYYNADNQLISQVSGNEKREYTYDRRGNLTTISRGEELLKAFTFDATNRMNSATEIKGGVEKCMEYCYNGLGQRVGQNLYTRKGAHRIEGQIPQKPEQQVRYILDLTRPYHNLLMKEDYVEQKKQTFYWDGNVTAMEDDGKGSYYLQDDLGSPMLILDEIGEVRETYGFDEFGMSLRCSSFEKKMIQPFGFTGYQMEETDGLYFAQARSYDALTGRFISEDQIRGNIVAPYTLNQYGYCWNNPLVLVDMDGLDPVTAAEGDEAHRKLQLFLAGIIHGVSYEVPIPNSSKNGNVGFADIVYEHDNIVEIYEIKPGSYAAQGSDRNIEGKEQLWRYIKNYYKGYPSFGGRVMVGTSLNATITVTKLPSNIHKDKLIKYYMYPADPGMIYWEYVNKPIKEPEHYSVPVIKRNEEMLKELGKATVIAGGAIIGYELIKWGLATVLAPATGGISVVGAACLP